MSAYPAYPYDSSYPPPQAYYGQPYPPHPPNGHPSHSPTVQPPARPHTTAPFPTTSQFAPPPSAGYYATPIPPPPQSNGHAPPTPSGAPSLPAAYPSQSPGAPSVYDNMSPEQLQGMIDQLRDLKMNKSSPKPAEATRSAAPPRIDTSIGPPPASQAPPQSARGPAPPSHGPYAYHYPYPYPPSRPAAASHNGEMSPPPSAHQSAKGYPSHHSSKASAAMPGSFYPEAPAPPLTPAAPPKTPGPGSNRPEPARKASEQASEVSYSSSTKSHIDMSQAWEQWGGPLVEISPGREPRPKPKLVSLFRGIAGYMIALLEPTQSCVVTLNKLIQFYNMFSVNDDLDWRKFFHARSPKMLSELFCALNVEHHLVSPSKANLPPSIPGLTPRGFEVWMFTQLMAAPSREHQRITKILDRWTIFEQGVEMPRLIPRECFPQGKDIAIYQGWWQAVNDDFPEDSADSDDERKLPLGLPEPEKRRRGYSIRGGDLPPEAGADEETSKESPTSTQAGRKKTGRHYTVQNPHEFLVSEEKESPSVERYRQTYPPSTNPGWKDEVRREEVNPRPTLGEEPVQRPPTRAQSTRAPKPVKDGMASTRKNAKRGRSVHRKRDESPDARYPSDDDYDDPKYEGYGKKYDADGLYESHVIGYGDDKEPSTDNWALSRYDDPSPPSRTTTPYHPSSSHPEPSYHRHPRGLSRPPPAAGKTEKDIKEYTYQDQYEREKDYSLPTGGPGRRQHRGSDAHGNRKSGQWRYGAPG